MNTADDFPFVKSRRAPKPNTLARENEALKAQLHALRIERDFWVEQARTLQNHLQTVLRGQASILEQLANYALDADAVNAAVDHMACDLRKPLTTVEAVRALTAAASGAQGRYTAVGEKDDELDRVQSEHAKRIARWDSERSAD